MKRSIIVAVAENGVIGKDNDLIWHLPRDLRFFQRTTKGHDMLMGRKTLQALGKPLKGRHHIVISRGFEYEHEQVSVVSSVEDGIALSEQRGENELFISGGGSIYQYCLDKELVDKLYITRVHHEFEGDTVFPEIDMQKWRLLTSVFYDADEKNQYGMTFEQYEKRTT